MVGPLFWGNDWPQHERKMGAGWTLSAVTWFPLGLPQRLQWALRGLSKTWAYFCWRLKSSPGSPCSRGLPEKGGKGALGEKTPEAVIPGRHSTAVNEDYAGSLSHGACICWRRWTLTSKDSHRNKLICVKCYIPEEPRLPGF